MVFKKRPAIIKAFTILASLLIGVLFVEVTCRLLGLDLEGRVASFKALPVFYRQPIEPVGEVFFRRPGPDAWRGNVLAVGFDKLAGGAHNPYLNEPEIMAAYDRDGFRNPEDLTDWDIVVVGDSFTELGFLPYDDLFTTRLGKLLGARVKNLGVSYTGTLTQTFYLKEYGISPSTRQSILVFFEGNDIDDIQAEATLLERFKATGERPYRNIEKQTSFIKFIYDIAKSLYGKWRTRSAGKEEAYYVSSGVEIPVTLSRPPPRRDELTSRQIELLDAALSRYAEAARSFGLTAWVVFMPCKQRALDCCLRFTANTDTLYVNWHPTDLPGLVEELATKNGLKFINVTPALVKAARDGVLTFNPIWDTHLNRAGSRVVAEAIAGELIRVRGS
ncbi:MAG: SGNH/GDSL hydrolase family protein [Acidobacteriota bacterium]|nr:SGNH/GDSL hydrolase family protein [Acidobacteriota bacterium]